MPLLQHILPLVLVLTMISREASCLPAPGHFLVETGDGEEVDGGKIDNKQVVGN